MLRKEEKEQEEVQHLPVLVWLLWTAENTEGAMKQKTYKAVLYLCIFLVGTPALTSTEFSLHCNNDSCLQNCSVPDTLKKKSKNQYEKYS